MYTNINYKPFASQVSLVKSKSSDNFYRKAAQHSLKNNHTIQTAESQCLACKHERQTSFGGTMRQPLGIGTGKISRKNVNEDYYKTNQDNQLVHVKKSKRYLEQLLEKTKNDFKKSIDMYEKRLAELNQEVKNKNQIIYQLKKIQNQKEAEQNYITNASLVQTYKQNNQKNQEEDLIKNRKIRELIDMNQELQDQLASVYQVAAQRLNKLQDMELQMVKMKQYQMNSTEIEAMKGLISKMQEEKLKLLDRQHAQLQQVQNRNNEEKLIQQTKIQELRSLLQTKINQLQQKQNEFKQLNNNYSMYRDQQYQTLKELLDERDKECMTLQSKLNCIQAELKFLKGRYGYVLRIAQNDQLMESRFNDPEEVCLERINRYQVSNGKQSMLGMNLSPIKRR